MINLINQLKTFFYQGSFVHRVTVLAGGTAVSQGFVVLTLPILTRLYTPDAMGKFSLFTAFITVAVVAASLLYEGAIVSAKDDKEAGYLVILSILLATLTAPLAILGLFILIKFDIFGFGKLSVQTLLWMLFTFLLASVFNILKYWFIRKNIFTLISKVTVIQNAVRTLSQLGLGILSFDWIGLLIGDVIGRGSGLGKMLKQSSQDLVRLIQPLSVSKLIEVGCQYSEFPLYALPSTVINILASSLPTPIIIHFHGAAAGGYFFLSQRTIALPISLISSAVADVFHHQITYYFHHEPAKVKHFFWKTAKSLALVGFLPAILIACVSPLLFSWVFGKAWAESGWFVTLITPWAFAGLISSSMSRIVFVVREQKWKLIFDIFLLMSQLIISYCISIFDLSLTNTVTMFGIVNTIVYGLYFVILSRIASECSQNLTNM